MKRPRNVRRLLDARRLLFFMLVKSGLTPQQASDRIAYCLRAARAGVVS